MKSLLKILKESVNYKDLDVIQESTIDDDHLQKYSDVLCESLDVIDEYSTALVDSCFVDEVLCIQEQGFSDLDQLSLCESTITSFFEADEDGTAKKGNIFKRFWKWLVALIKSVCNRIKSVFKMLTSVFKRSQTSATKTVAAIDELEKETAEDATLYVKLKDFKYNLLKNDKEGLFSYEFMSDFMTKNREFSKYLHTMNRGRIIMNDDNNDVLIPAFVVGSVVSACFGLATDMLVSGNAEEYSKTDGFINKSTRTLNAEAINAANDGIANCKVVEAIAKMENITKNAKPVEMSYKEAKQTLIKYKHELKTSIAFEKKNMPSIDETANELTKLVNTMTSLLEKVDKRIDENDKSMDFKALKDTLLKLSAVSTKISVNVLNTLSVVVSKQYLMFSTNYIKAVKAIRRDYRKAKTSAEAQKAS